MNTIQIDAAGRLVLPKAMRERLDLRAGSRLRADIVAGHIELTPLSNDEPPALRSKAGIKVLARTGARVDAAAAVAAERDTQEDRGAAR